MEVVGPNHLRSRNWQDAIENPELDDQNGSPLFPYMVLSKAMFNRVPQQVPSHKRLEATQDTVESVEKEAAVL